MPPPPPLLCVCAILSLFILQVYQTGGVTIRNVTLLKTPPVLRWLQVRKMLATPPSLTHAFSLTLVLGFPEDEQLQ